MADIALTASTPDGEAKGRLLTPDTGDGPWPLVVVLVDAAGVRPAMLEMAGHLTDAGYAALLPDPYWRQEPWEPFDAKTAFTDPAERARIFRLIDAMVTAEWIADAEALIARIDDPRVTASPLRFVGFCMGGRAAFVAATLLGEEVEAVACIHAGGLVGDSEQSPHRAASAIRARVYLGVADEDRSCTPEHQAALREALEGAGVAHELELYPGARHGFAALDFPVYDEEAAAKSWAKVLGLFAGTVD